MNSRFEIAHLLESALFTSPEVKVSKHSLAKAAAAHASRVTRLQEWRARNPELFEARRVAGMKRSSRVQENIRRLHTDCKEAWRASALKNPKLQATSRHIAAKEWPLRAPDGQLHRVRNLKKFIRDNPALFDEADVQWKHPEGKPQLSWCRAFQALARLRPTSANPLPEWEGWKWAAQELTYTAPKAQPRDGMILQAA